MSRCHFGRGLFMIHSFSFKCESHWGGVCSSSEMYKKKISCWSGEAARGDTSFYFLNVCGLCSRENRRVCDQSCFAVMEEGKGGGGKNRRSGVFDAWREASVFRGTLEMKVVIRVGPLPAGTLHSRVGHQRIYNMYCGKARLCFAERTCLWKSVELTRPCRVMCHLQHCHWVELPQETPICFIALLKRHDACWFHHKDRTTCVAPTNQTRS